MASRSATSRPTTAIEPRGAGSTMPSVALLVEPDRPAHRAMREHQYRHRTFWRLHDQVRHDPAVEDAARGEADRARAGPEAHARGTEDLGDGGRRQRLHRLSSLPARAAHGRRPRARSPRAGRQRARRARPRRLPPGSPRRRTAARALRVPARERASPAAAGSPRVHGGSRRPWRATRPGGGRKPRTRGDAPRSRHLRRRARHRRGA